MKIRSLILPMLLFVGVIGMAFTTADLNENPNVQAIDYVLLNGSWLAINEQDCQGEGFTCQVAFEQDGPSYPVYDEMNDREPKQSSSAIPVLITP